MSSKPTRVVDAHAHFWAVDNAGHDWPTPDWPLLYRGFGQADLLEAAKGVPLAGIVLVQSQPTDWDTDWLLSLAESNPFVRAVVGWVDLASPSAPARIAALSLHGKFRGLRPMLQSMEETDWLLRPELEPALEAMVNHGLRLDALVQPRHLPMLARFIKRWHQLPLVIDHAAKPQIARGGLDPWRDDIAALAAMGSYCKFSGLRTEQPKGQPVGALRPYSEHLLASFGDRLMWGSDWPVILLSGDGYHDWLTHTAELVSLEDEARTAWLYEGCAAHFYGFDSPLN